MIIFVCSSASVFEEEDFQAMTYGFSLCSDVTASKASSLLKEAEDAALKVKRDPSDADQTHRSLVDALTTRLKFTRSLTQVLACFNKRASDGLPQAAKAAVSCFELCALLKETVGLGVQPSDAADYQESRGES